MAGTETRLDEVAGESGVGVNEAPEAAGEPTPVVGGKTKEGLDVGAEAGAPNEG